MNRFPAFRLFAVAMMFVFLALPAAAQFQTGEIFGKAMDESGSVLPGATVTLTSPALLRSQAAVTTASGAYRFPNIPIGVYSVTVELSGFAKTIRKDIKIETGFNAQVDFKVKVSSIQETVTVSGEAPIIDTRSNAVVAVFSKEMMESIPNARDPWVILEQTPGMVMDRQNVGGNASGQQSSFLAHGSSANQNWNLDGATITDMASDSSPTYYDFDSFEEIQITTGGNDASQDTGGVSVNFVTKSGGNKFRGSTRLFVTDQSLQSKKKDASVIAQGGGAGNPIKNIKDYGFEIGGPIKRDKAWFWAAASQNDIKVGVLGFLKNPAGDPNDVDNLETDLTTLKNYNAKITYQWSKGMKTNVQFARGDKIRNARGSGPLNPIETTTRQTGPTNMYLADHQWIVTDKFTINGRFSYVDGGFLLNFHDDALRNVQPTFDIVTTVNGRSGSLSNNIRPTWEYKVDSNYFVSNVLGGDHAMKFGARYRKTPYQTISITGGGATARFRNGVASEANITRDGDTNRNLYEYSGWVNDSWRRNKLTFNVGLRYDYQKDFALAASIPANPILPDLLPAVAFTGADSGASFGDVSPRFGITYDLGTTQRTVLKATAARYYGLGIYTAGTLSPTGQTTLRYPWNDANRDGVVSRNELTLSNLLTFSSNYDPANPASVRSPNTVDPNLTNDKTDEIVAGIERQIGKDVAVGVTYIWRHYYNYNDLFPVGLTSSQYQPVSLTAACAARLVPCDQASYTVQYWQLPTQIPAANILRTYQTARRYSGIEIVARKRMSHRWMANGSVTFNSTVRKYEGGPDLDYYDPTNVAQQEGVQFGSLNARWVAKLSGAVQLPYSFGFGAFINARQGFPFLKTVLSPTRTGGIGTVSVYTEPYGASRYPNFVQVDVKVDRRFKIGRGKFTAGVDAFNLMNKSTVLSRIGRQNATNANQIQTILAPRVFRVGLRAEF